MNSKIIGRYEPKEMWKVASIIDIYNIENKTYLSSFYIYDAHEKKVNEMLIVNDNLFAIIGNQLHKYRLNRLQKTNTK